ncbi:Bug family tripartite tricarboxylate transporter substrate binding protein [Falsiroseomonas selenitidurans]|uniref:Tripartite tricarboxylate transporter substrate binding protein n=1 Tax=Falsiroseomonas selenitidurans TaxID=2716335 RepID=A0ABX1EBI6_9PROT|nr:tripartite tricarboxylate transporter substrate binding protein [Falsiroseomonas selenitidurans]NKC34361.1 tripartite tricarboxylate transporter substrate binding protein [Falsiroseomonas selenitidurans]
MPAPRPTRRALLASALALPALGGPAFGQGWSPDRPVRLVVPFAPGGSQDVLGRLFAQAVTATVGQNVVVENRAGAGGLLGAEAVAKAAPDGTTLLLATAGQLTIAKAIGRRLSYDPIADFAPILHISDSPVALIAAPNLPVQDLPGLLALARAAPQPMPYASTGIGTNTHLIMEDLKARERLNIEHVPYRGAAAAFNDLMAGRIAMMFVSVPSVLGFSGGQLRVMGVTSRTRFPAVAQVPTLIEGGVPDFEASIWTGLVAPAGTPPAAVARWGDAFRQALESAPVKTRLAALGAVPNGADAAAFGALLRADLARWTRVAAPLAIRLD